MTNYLGIDYGEAHIGLAYADGPLASPLSTLNNTDAEVVVTQITAIIERQNIDHIVVGLPHGRLEKTITDFGTKLSQLTNREVSFHPETLSTQEAIAKLRESGAKRRKLQNDHVYAACLILEDYLVAETVKS